MKTSDNQLATDGSEKLRAIVLYHSIFSNTRKIAEALGRGLSSGGVKVDVVPITAINEVKIQSHVDKKGTKITEDQNPEKKMDLSELNKYDIIAVGGPTHMGRVSNQMKLFLEVLSRSNNTIKKGFCF